MRSETKRERNSRRISKRQLSEFARALLAELEILEPSLLVERLVVAVSGGADSCALLLGLEELRARELMSSDITVAHLNHRLRGKQSAADAKWVGEHSKSLGFDSRIGSAAVKELASKSRDNLEQAARRARYKFLYRTAKAVRARFVLTAHTMDDQAETILLRLIRGSGMDGLGGIETVRELEAGREVLLVRPLLRWARRSQTEDYCRLRKVEFRIDEMNDDPRFTRVRVRKELLPLMESFNARIVETIARTADLISEDSAALELEAQRLYEKAREAAGVEYSEVRDRLQVQTLSEAHPAIRRRALRIWIANNRGDLRRLERVHIQAVERLLEGNRGGRFAVLPGGARILRKKNLLIFLKAEDRAY